jgi:hypothetical protein
MCITRRKEMTVIIHKESHVDHELFINLENILKTRFANKTGFFIESIDLEVPVGMNALYGPVCCDKAVSEEEVSWEKRDGRDYESRMIDAPMRPSTILTVIAGPHDGHDCVLFTAYAGPVAPKGLNDPTLKEEEREEAEKFWSEHALATGSSNEDVICTKYCVTYGLLVALAANGKDPLVDTLYLCDHLEHDYWVGLGVWKWDHEEREMIGTRYHAPHFVRASEVLKVAESVDGYNKLEEHFSEFYG